MPHYKEGCKFSWSGEVLAQKKGLRVTHSKALRDRLEARVLDLLSLNVWTELDDLDLQRAS